jgi:hypothetical protein
MDLAWSTNVCRVSGYVFISYSSADRAYVQRLADDLMGNGLVVWFDPQIGPGEHFAGVIQQKIDDCAAFVVVMSPAAMASKWVQREVEWADRRNKPVLPLLLDGEVFFQYANTQYVDVRRGRLPGARFVAELRRVCGLDDTPETSPTPAPSPRSAATTKPRKAAPPRPEQPAIGGPGRRLLAQLAIAGLVVALLSAVAFWAAPQRDVAGHLGPARPATASTTTQSLVPAQRLRQPATVTDGGVTYTLISIVVDPHLGSTTFTLSIANNSTVAVEVAADQCCSVVENPRAISHTPLVETYQGTLLGPEHASVPPKQTQAGTLVSAYVLDPASTSLVVSIRIFSNGHWKASIIWTNVELI